MSRLQSRFDPRVVRFVLTFFFCAAVLSLAIQIPWVTEQLVVPYTSFLARLSAQILGLIGLPPTVAGTSLSRAGVTVEIRRGCDGLEAAILLISACLAYPARWKSRLTGTLMGFVLIFVINIFRIVGLSYLGFTGNQQDFDFAHIYVAQFAIIAVTMVFWVFWAGKQKPLSS